MSEDSRTYAMMIKPVSSACNLHCTYCYYAGKKNLLNIQPSIMPLEVLEEFTRQNISMHGRNAVIEFAWHGGEPLLAGVNFFREAVKLQNKYGDGRKILNTLQTNGTLLNEEFCEFFSKKNFLLGVSIDGPKNFHNAYRENSFDEVMRGIELLKKYKISFNTLTAVNNINSQRPREIYLFLRELTDYVQFLPVVEFLPSEYEINVGQNFAKPSGIYFSDKNKKIASFSVEPKQWGIFLREIFELWFRYDLGKKHVQLIDAALENLKGVPCSLCVHSPLCGHSGCVEANGDLYSCDRYAFPSYYLGNILDTELEKLMALNKEFGFHKIYGLSEKCFGCCYMKFCLGGCPKDRISGKNYLCEGYKIFFAGMDKKSPHS